MVPLTADSPRSSRSSAAGQGPVKPFALLPGLLTPHVWHMQDVRPVPPSTLLGASPVGAGTPPCPEVCVPSAATLMPRRGLRWTGPSGPRDTQPYFLVPPAPSLPFILLPWHISQLQRKTAVLSA